MATNDDTTVKMVDLSNDEEKRETWGHKIEFILTCVGYCVGLGNVWRFPYLAFNNGGGAFLIPYFIMLLICGMPLFLMELALGQYFSLGPVSTWNAACPLAKGIGFAMIAVAFLCTVYYNVVVAWVIYYMYRSMASVVPWKYCGNPWNGPLCYDGYNDTVVKTYPQEECRWVKKTGPPPLNTTALPGTASLPPATTLASLATTAASGNTNLVNVTEVGNFTWKCFDTGVNYTSPSQEFWDREVLDITNNLGDSGSMQPGLALCLVIAWALVFLCLIKGIQSSGKVVYFTATFPYLVMFILMIRGALLEGAGEGIVYYLKPDFTKLANAEVWVAAATQIFYSLGIGFGSLIAFGSYNKFHNNVVRDAVCLSIVNCFTSVFAGIVVFSVLGHMAHKSKVNIDKVATSGPGLVFVVYPEGLSQMPISPLWGILFFFMILTIGLDTQFAMLEAVIVGFIDEIKFLKKRKVWFTLSVCFVALLFGLPMVMQNGMYIFNIFNTQSGGVSLLFLAFFETIAVAYGYGAERFEKNLEEILCRKPARWWRWCIKYVSPLVILIILITSLVQWKGITYNNYKYPGYGEFIGWMLALLSMVWIPGVAAWKIFKQDGTLLERVRKLCQPSEEIMERVRSANSLEEQLPLQEKKTGIQA